MALDVKRFTARFVEEARDHLHRLEEGLTALQGNPADQETINTIFRSAHTIKGSSRMLKFMAINDTAHKLEDVLGAMRGGSLAYSAELAGLLARGIDAIALQVDHLAEGRELAPADQALGDELLRVASGSAAVAPASPDQAAAVASDQPSPPPEPPSLVAAAGAAGGGAPRLRTPDTVRVSMSKLDELIKLMGEVVSSHARLRQRVADIRDFERAQAGVGHPPSNRLRELGQDLKDDVLAQELLMEELHGKALVMRMLPLAMVFESAPRMVRDLARAVGKEVDCSVSGTEIELDRQLIDRLGDPIVHLLRNAVDHGIEAPADREQAGKPRVGRVQLRARQESGRVVIEIGDDGAGIPLSAIRDKAVRKGLMTTERAAALSESEVVDLIFLPGFSTNSIITDVSGRGVGMDVVKRCVVDELQGTIGVDSRPGVGTTFVLQLPLSLAVMRVLMVGVGGETFGFTAQQVVQLLRLPADQLLAVAERQTVVVRNEFIPVEGLAGLLSLPPPRAAPEDDLLLVVVQVGSEKLALRVDELIDERDMVIKPLPAHLSHLTMVSGMVMTGRNALVSVLHAPVLLAMARAGVSAPAAKAEQRHSRVLVVDDSLNTREIERDVLEAHGYQVTLAEDGRDGLRKALDGAFDAVLTDVEMPHMDGFALVAALRQDERYRDVPIIIITSRQKEEDKRRGIQVGADAYIVKGDFDQGGLVATLRSLIG